MAKVFFDQDINLDVLKGQTVAVIGYGNQGRSQSLNLRDSGISVVIGNKDDDYAARARMDGMKVLNPVDAADLAEVVMLIVPDEVQSDVFNTISPGLKSGDLVLFSHGYNIFYKLITPPKDLDIGLVAPRMIGDGVRICYKEGFPTLVGIEQDASGTGWARTLAIAKGIGGTRKGAWQTTFEEETIVDLFGEQAGGASGLQSTLYAWETLVEAGYNPEVVLLELYASGEMAEVYRGIHQRGLLESLKMHSPTSQYGQMSRAARMVPKESKDGLKALLTDLQDGSFAKEWAKERQSKYKHMEDLRSSFNAHPMFKSEKSVMKSMHGAKGNQEE